MVGIEETPLAFDAGGLRLEGMLHMPRRNGGPVPGVVVCHPHPLYGGNMDSSVVVAICEQLALGGMAALRFNFRGVGASEGDFAGGEGERGDVQGALTALIAAQGVDASYIGLAGYSFGAGVAAAVAPNEDRVRALALVSPALRGADGWRDLQQYGKPKFVLCGNVDQFVKLSDGVRQTGWCQIVPGADHFWWGAESTVGKSIAAFFAGALLGRD